MSDNEVKQFILRNDAVDLIDDVYILAVYVYLKMLLDTNLSMGQIAEKIHNKFGIHESVIQEIICNLIDKQYDLLVTK